MKYASIFGEILLIIRPANKLEITELAEGCAIAVIDEENNITVKPELSDLTEQAAKVCQSALSDISKGFAIYESLSTRNGLYELTIPEARWHSTVLHQGLFTDDKETMIHLFKAGARCENMVRLEQTLEEGELFIENPYSEEAEKYAETLLENHFGAPEGNLEKAGQQCFISLNTKTKFEGRPSRIFVESILNMKHRLLAGEYA